MIVRVTPESGAVNVKDNNVVFEFDAIVNDRGGQGDLSSLVRLSPRDGATSVRWRRNRIEVRPRRGFRPGTAYAVTLLPGVADLNGNATRVSRTVVFSTGPTIPAFAIHGRVFDWIGGRTAPDAPIEVIRLPDSLLYVSSPLDRSRRGATPFAPSSTTIAIGRSTPASRGIPSACRLEEKCHSSNCWP